VSQGRFNLSALAVRERAITLFLIFLISAAGILAFAKLGRAEDPPFTIKQMTIVTAWPGATAQEMQEQVAEPLEKRMQELRWYDRSETFTRPGLAFTMVSLLDSAPPSQVQEEFYQARKKISDEARRLPAGVIGPMVNDECAMPRCCASNCCTWRASRRSTSSGSSPSGSLSRSPMTGWPRWVCHRKTFLLPSTAKTC
jgi:multidrug efflux pump subunit AcrB